jgi:hypothetical protein
MPPKPRSMELTPVRMTEVSYESLYPCDPDSTLNGIAYQKTKQRRISVKNGREITEKLNLTDYSMITSWINGTYNLIESNHDN